MKTKPMIVSVSHGAAWGAESVLEAYLRSKPDVVVAAPPDSRVAKVAIEMEVAVWPLNKSRDAFFKNVRSAIVCDLPPNIGLVHSWCARSVESAWILSKRLKVPFTLGLHDSPDQSYHGYLRRQLIFLGASTACDVATVSRAMQRKCSEINFPKSPKLIYNGIPDIGEPSPPPSVPKSASSCVLGFLGMNAPHKGFAFVGKWIHLTECQWHLYGEIHPDLQSDVDDLLALYPERVRFLGRADNRQLYKDLDLVVYPSKSFESFGLVIVEAARAGLPVVAADVGGVSEVINHGESGYLFDRDDADSGLVWIEQLLHEPEIRYHMGQMARRNYLNYFTAEVMSGHWNQFFREHLK